jgi:peptidoglycan hydrolase-like protein with peptidoglycan-binding domain
VKAKKYKLTYARIAGYGRPNYGMKIETSTPTVYKLGDRTLRKGDEGDDVKELQTALKGLGYNLGTYGPAKDGVDGDYGTKTQTAVSALQKARGLTVDGVFGTQTYNALLEAMSPEPTPEEPDRDTYVLVIEGDKDALRAIQAEHGGTLAAAADVKIAESGTT